MSLRRDFDTIYMEEEEHQVAGNAAHPSSVSNLYVQGFGQSQMPANSQMNASFGNFPNSVSGNRRSRLGPASEHINRVFNGGSNLGTNSCASSPVTDANSTISHGSQFHRGTSIDTESYLQFPTSPISFSSDNIGVSGSPVMDGSSIHQQNFQPQQIWEWQQPQQHGASSATSRMPLQTGIVSPRIVQDLNGLLSMQYKPELVIRQDNSFQLQGKQKLLQTPDSIRLQGHNPQLQASIQPQILRSLPQMQQAHMHRKTELGVRQDDFLQQQLLQRSDSIRLQEHNPQLHILESMPPMQQVHMQKKPELGIRQDDAFQQEVMQQLLQRPDSIRLQEHNPQLQTSIQQQILQSLPQMQQAHMQQQQQLRQQLQQQGQTGQYHTFGAKYPYGSGLCARRLMQYLYHMRTRPTDNNILYWRKFVSEYYAPNAKKRWCFSLYDREAHSSLGDFPQEALLSTWHCDMCGIKPTRGFETTADMLPRLIKYEFESGVIDEILFLDMPYECRSSSGLMMLEYRKATLETVYEQLRVVHEGQLRIIYTIDLKILSWEFCAWRHEVLFPRRLIAPQLNQLVQVEQKLQSVVTEIESGSAISPQDLQTNCNMFVEVGCQLMKDLDLQLVNDFGLSRRFLRCLQMTDVINSIKDHIDFSQVLQIGPIAEILKRS